MGQLAVIANQTLLRMMSLGIILPSNNPKAYFANFGATLQFLRQGLELVSIEILLCAQKPWSEDLIAQAMAQALQHGIRLRHRFADATKPPLMCMYRQKAADLYPGPTVYMLADDNMRFAVGENTADVPHTMTSGQCYAEVLDYMAHYPRCGLVQCHTTAPDGFARSIRPTANGLITTNKGLFLRNIARGYLWPTFSFAFMSSLEETVAGYRILEQGYFPARQHQNPTIHQIHKLGSDDHLHSRELIMANAGAWVRRHFEDPHWEHESGEFPMSLIRRARQYSDEISFDPSDNRYVRVYESSDSL